METPLLDREALRDHMRAGGPWAIECGARVRKIRTDRGLTLDVVAALVDTTAATVSRIELGAALPSDRLRSAIAYALCAEVSELWPYPTRKRLAEVAAA